MSTSYRRKPRKPTTWAPTATVDYTDCDSLVADLETGQLADLAAVARRVRAIAESAHHAGVLAGAEAAAEQIQKLAAENRAQRVRLVQKSLVDSAAVAW